MPIASNIIFVWSGTDASIPEGWTRETDLDGKYLYGCASDDTSGGATGGNATHSHSPTGHTHTISTEGETSETGYKDRGREQADTGSHTHASFDSNTSGNYGTESVETDPDYYEVIFIKSNGTHYLPTNAIAFFDCELSNDNWKYCDGTNSTPNFDKKFLKGAGNGADAGGTGSGSHTHTVNNHSHSATASPKSTDEIIEDADRGEGISGAGHTHNVSLVSNSQTMNTTTILPPYKSFCAYQNQGSASMLDGMIGIWKGNKADIPTYWEEVTSLRELFLRVDTEGLTGGTETHTHTANSHTHEALQGQISAQKLSFLFGRDASNSTHEHSWDVSSEIETFSAESNIPEYVKVFFIKFTLSYCYKSFDITERDVGIETEERKILTEIDERDINIETEERKVKISIDERDIITDTEVCYRGN